MRLREILAALWLSACILSAGEQRFVIESARVIDASMRGLMEKHHVPGVSVALVANERVRWTQTFGVANAKTGQPVDTNTLFEAASMSKPLFAYAALKLVEQGQLDLDRPLVEYLLKPYLTNLPAHRKITARMVLTHRSGFPNWRKGGWRSKNPLALKFEPGAKFGYSGEGFLYLQRVVEHVTKQSLDDFMHKRLLRPLGMNTSSYRWQTNRAKLIAAGHDAEGKFKTGKRRYDRPNAAYSLFTTPAEYAQILIEMMRKDRSAEHSLAVGTVAEMLQRVSYDEAKQRHFGLGWTVFKTPVGVRYGHGGANGSGFRCFSRFDPSSGTGMVIMTNGVGGKALYQELFKALDTALGDG